MFALAYVLLAPKFVSLQDALDTALAPFRRGGLGDLPKDELAFDDVTAELRTLHLTSTLVRLGYAGGLQFQGEGAASSHILDTDAVEASLTERGLVGRPVRLSDLEPDADLFAATFASSLWDEEVGSFGEWLNPLGRWDW